MGLLCIAIAIVLIVVAIRKKRATPSIQNTTIALSVADALTVNKCVVLDVETTGLDPQSDKIIEIAMLEVNEGIVKKKYHTLVNPKRIIPDKITDLTGISQNDVRNAKPYKEMVQEVHAFLGDSPIVAHNSEFDAKFIAKAFSLAGIYHPIRHIDTMAMAKQAYQNMPNYKLDTLIKQLSLADGPQTHRANADAVHTWHLFVKCKSRLLALKELSVEVKEAAKIKEKVLAENSPALVFAAYDETKALLAQAWAKSPESTEVIFGEASSYLEEAFDRKIKSIMEKEFFREKRAIGQLKTRKSANNHIEKFSALYLSNQDKLSKESQRALTEYIKSLETIRDMCSPE